MSVKEKPRKAVATAESIRFTSDVLPFQKMRAILDAASQQNLFKSFFVS